MKKPKIRQILEERVFKKIISNFEEKGFKYKKGIRGFYKRENGFLYEVSIYDEYDIFMDISASLEHELYLTFEMSFEVELFEFEKWYEDIFRGSSKGHDHTRIDTFHDYIKFCIPLKSDVDFIIPDDFNPNQQTFIGEDLYLEKILPNNKYKFSSFGQIEEVDDFDAHINKVFDILEEMITTKYDFLQLYNSEKKDDLGHYNSEYMKYNALLIYDNQLTLPTKFIIEMCNNIISEINQMTEESKKEQRIQSLNRFISIAEKHLDLKVDNPYENKNSH